MKKYRVVFTVITVEGDKIASTKWYDNELDLDKFMGLPNATIVVKNK